MIVAFVIGEWEDKVVQFVFIPWIFFIGRYHIFVINF